MTVSIPRHEAAVVGKTVSVVEGSSIAVPVVGQAAAVTAKSRRTSVAIAFLNRILTIIVGVVRATKAVLVIPYAYIIVMNLGVAGYWLCMEGIHEKTHVAPGCMYNLRHSHLACPEVNVMQFTAYYTWNYVLIITIYALHGVI